MALAAARGGSWAWLLFYPAFSLGAVAAAYFLSAPAVFWETIGWESINAWDAAIATVHDLCACRMASASSALARAKIQ